MIIISTQTLRARTSFLITGDLGRFFVIQPEATTAKAIFVFRNHKTKIVLAVASGCITKKRHCLRWKLRNLARSVGYVLSRKVTIKHKSKNTGGYLRRIALRGDVVRF